MNFSQYLNKYMTLRNATGVNPTTEQGQAIFAPYFDQQARAAIQGEKLNQQQQAIDLNKQALEFQKEKNAGNLAYDRWYANLQKDQANRQDRNATIGNVISGLGSIGSAYMTSQSPYWQNINRRNQVYGVR